MEAQIDFEGVDELATNIEKAFEKCPDEMSKAMRKAANGWKKEVSAKFPKEPYMTHASAHNKNKRLSKSASKSWKSKSEYTVYGYTGEIDVANTNRLWHLVENGHREVLFGKETGGFVPGKHYKDSVNEEYETKYPEEMDKAATKALTEAGLL